MNCGYITKDFRYAEFFRHGMPEDFEQFCSVCQRIRSKLVEPLLQPMRSELGIPVRITSGYRTEAENERVGGHTHSHHLYGADHAAADFTCADMEAAWLFVRAYSAMYSYAYWDVAKHFIHVSARTETQPKRIGDIWVVGEKKPSTISKNRN